MDMQFLQGFACSDSHHVHPLPPQPKPWPENGPRQLLSVSVATLLLALVRSGGAGPSGERTDAKAMPAELWTRANVICGRNTCCLCSSHRLHICKKALRRAWPTKSNSKACSFLAILMTSINLFRYAFVALHYTQSLLKP